MVHTFSDGLSFQDADTPLMFCWAFGDFHFRARERWRILHEQRLAPMFEDLQALWQAEGAPDFCVSPGDIVQSGAPENYELARATLAARLDDIPFYPGIGNHEYHRERAEDRLHSAEDFRQAWGRPALSSWTAGTREADRIAGVAGVVCIMLDFPDPFTSDPSKENPHVVYSQQALSFLDKRLAASPGQVAVIFAHCPLYDTVRARDEGRTLDHDSLEDGFFVENSREVRAILARHQNAVLYVSGHTHAGWMSPRLVYSERLDEHSITHVNLMSPWSTGRHHGPRRVEGPTKFIYVPDEPDLLISFAIRVYRGYTIIKAREHKSRSWLAEWRVPIE